MRDLPLIACEAGTYKGFGILLDGRPPKLSLEEFKGVSSAWMAGQMRGVTPLENLGVENLVLFLGLELVLLYFPVPILQGLQGPHYLGAQDNGCDRIFLVTACMSCKFDIFGARVVGYPKLKPDEE